MLLLFTGSTRRIWASWTAGLAWSTCKLQFICVLTIFPFSFSFIYPVCLPYRPFSSLLLSPCARWEDPQTCFLNQALGRKIFLLLYYSFHLLFSLKSQALLQNIPHKCLRELRCFKGFHSSVCFRSLSLSLNLSLSFPVARTEKENTSTLPSWSETCWNNLIVLNLITKTSLWQSRTLSVCGRL